MCYICELPLLRTRTFSFLFLLSFFVFWGLLVFHLFTCFAIYFSIFLYIIFVYILRYFTENKRGAAERRNKACDVTSAPSRRSWRDRRSCPDPP